MAAPDAPRIIKKYGNRRLYDTRDSQYLTLDQLEAHVRAGEEIRVVDAASGADLTQPTLTQIIMESRDAGRLLPVPLLVQLVRMGDDALAEFLGRYLTLALELYLQARHGAQALSPFNPLASVPFTAANALARLLNAAPWVPQGPLFGAPAPSAPPQPPPAPPSQADDVAALRRELEALKDALRPAPAAHARKPAAAPRKKPAKKARS